MCHSLYAHDEISVYSELRSHLMLLTYVVSSFQLRAIDEKENLTTAEKLQDWNKVRNVESIKDKCQCNSLEYLLAGNSDFNGSLI